MDIIRGQLDPFGVCLRCRKAIGWIEGQMLVLLLVTLVVWSSRGGVMAVRL